MNDDTASTDKKNKLVSPLFSIISLVITAGFFLFMTNVAYSHTPDWADKYRLVAAGYTSLCLTGVFWLVLQGFWVTLVDQLRRKKAGVQS